MARPKRPNWKDIVLKELATACNKPGGSYLLRNEYAKGAAAILGYQESTVCKYVENLLGKHHKEEW
ncbi:hypothetical protein LCM00_15175 [Bacillus infantis]|uniref:hypothetical protein n=1 Tax=Bacillus infantis TaxID=324767 RepID=UPI001CD4E77A|nr:hypothetical protein [Bacillus infantis]MCA1040856.1 hypothetical protein [Bacillus infantis]